MWILGRFPGEPGCYRDHTFFSTVFLTKDILHNVFWKAGKCWLIDVVEEKNFKWCIFWITKGFKRQKFFKDHWSWVEVYGDKLKFFQIVGHCKNLLFFMNFGFTWKTCAFRLGVMNKVGINWQKHGQNSVDPNEPTIISFSYLVITIAYEIINNYQT